MQIKLTTNSPTEAALSIIAKQEELAPIKEQVIQLLGKQVKIQGFREGKAPLNLIEKQLDQQVLQQTFLEEAINQMYPQAVQQQKLRPVSNPEIQVKKFVPFTDLEFEAKVPVVGDIKLPDYKKMKLEKKQNKITAKDVNEVVENLRTRLAADEEVKRASKDTDKLWIDFVGADTKGEPIKGADGKDYPLVLGSGTFIPGFEENLVGVSAGDEKKFTLTFPKDYGVKAMANKKVAFTVTVNKVCEVTKPKVDDELAKQAGPFETMQQLKDDIKVQLQQERDQQDALAYESELVQKITTKTTVELPQVIVDETIDRMVNEHKQNLTYRGQTFAEFLEAEGQTEEEYKKSLAPTAEERVKGSLVLSEVAEVEDLSVTPEELEIRMQVMKGQYKDPQTLAELEKPEVRRDIAMRMLSEKTVAKLAEYAQK